MKIARKMTTTALASAAVFALLAGSALAQEVRQSLDATDLVDGPAFQDPDFRTESSLDEKRITDIGAPVEDGDISTKNYVDQSIAEAQVAMQAQLTEMKKTLEAQEKIIDDLCRRKESGFTLGGSGNKDVCKSGISSSSVLVYTDAAKAASAGLVQSHALVMKYQPHAAKFVGAAAHIQGDASFAQDLIDLEQILTPAEFNKFKTDIQNDSNVGYSRVPGIAIVVDKVINRYADLTNAQ